MILHLLSCMPCDTMPNFSTTELAEMNFFAKLHIGVAFIIAPFVQALELSDLRLPLTRTEADSFTKDYDYEVLSDHSIRRTWRVAGRKIAIDFENKTDSAICITVTYVEPVPRKEGLADAKILAGDKVDAPKWKQVKNEAAAKFGMKHAEALQLNDGTYLFREVTDDKKKRFTRLSLYAKMPKEDRATLAVLDATGGKTALGSATVGTAVKELYEDEAARRGSGGAPAVAAADEPADSVATPSVHRITALGSTPGARAALRREQEAAAAEAEKSVAPETPVVKPQPTEQKKTAKPLADRTLMEALGLDNPGPVQFGVIGGIVLLLIIIVISRANAAKRKAAQKAKFTAVLLNNNKSSAPKLKRH